MEHELTQSQYQQRVAAASELTEGEETDYRLWRLLHRKWRELRCTGRTEITISSQEIQDYLGHYFPDHTFDKIKPVSLHTADEPQIDRKLQQVYEDFLATLRPEDDLPPGCEA